MLKKKKTTSPFYGKLFRLARAMVRWVKPKFTVQLPKHLDEPVVFISHHQNLFGPFTILLWFTRCVHTWMLHVFLDRKTCYRQYTEYTFTKRFGWNKTLAKLVALPLSYLISQFMHSCRGIPVYRSSRKIIETLKESVDVLIKGENILIFPDIDYTDVSSQIKEMYDGFLVIEKYYFKATGKHIRFVPLYVSKNKKGIFAMDAISFRNDVNFNDEKQRVYQNIQTSLNDMARACGDIQ